MMEKCPNCQQPILPDDTECWRCGQRLTPAEPIEEEPTLSRTWFDDEGGIVGDIQNLPYATVVYGFVTFALLVMIWISWQLLGVAPLAQISFSQRIPVGYEVVSAAEQRFSIDLPRTWNTMDKVEEPQRLADFLGQYPLLFNDALRPLALEAGDLEIIFAAADDELFDPLVSSFVVVARSARLSRFSPQQAAAAAEQVGWLPVARVEIVEDLAKSHVAIEMVNLPLDVPAGVQTSGYHILCTQQFIPGSPESLLMAICTPNRVSTGLIVQNDRVLKEDVMAGFEYLRPAGDPGE